MTASHPRCRLYAVVEADASAPERLAAALAAVDLASVLIVAPPDARLQAADARPLVELAQKADVAVLIAGDAQLARTLRADGVHLAPAADVVADYETARSILGARGLIGVDPGISRDDAMTLAEAGADYIAFGVPAHFEHGDHARVDHRDDDARVDDRDDDARVDDPDDARALRDELVGWWGEIFEVPGVAFDVEAPEEAAHLARLGADFIAVRLERGDPAAAAARLAAIADALRVAEVA